MNNSTDLRLKFEKDHLIFGKFHILVQGEEYIIDREPHPQRIKLEHPAPETGSSIHLTVKSDNKWLRCFFEGGPSSPEPEAIKLDHEIYLIIDIDPKEL